MSNIQKIKSFLTEDGKAMPKPHFTAEEKELNAQREQAWKSQYSLRFCPPIELLCKQTPEVKIHMATCPMCQKRLQELEEAQIQPEHFAKAASVPLTSVEVGGIYSLSSKLHGWDETYQYLIAPQVLVLEKKPNAATVAVLSSALTFAHTTKRNAVLPYHVFAETWNTFDMPVSLFERHIVTLSDEEMQEVERIRDESYRVQAEDVWSQEFMRAEAELAEMMQARAHCLAVDKARAWDWKQAYSDLLYKVQELFAVSTPALQAASVGEKVQMRIQTAQGVQSSYADIEVCNVEKGYVRLNLHLPKDTHIVHVMVFAEQDGTIANGVVDMDDTYCYVNFEENVLSKDSTLSVFIVTSE